MPAVQEELLTLVIYIAALYVLILASMQLIPASKAYASSASKWAKSQELETSINSEISNFFIKYSKGIYIGSPVVSSRGRAKVYGENVTIPILPIEGDCEPY